MICNKRILAAAVAVMTLCASVSAQVGGDISSYSRFGIGLPGDGATSFNKSMAGAGMALASEGNRVNILNPASYSNIDSVTFIIDAGMSLAMGNMKQDGVSRNVKSAALDYVVCAFRLRKNLGMTIGFSPYTMVGYNFTSTDKKYYEDLFSSQTVTQTTQYSGKGGLNQAYAGLGYRVYRGLSLGVNAGIIWGDLQNNVYQSFTEGGTQSQNYNSMYVLQSTHITTYKIEVGAQYMHVVNPLNRLNFGATASIGHNLSSSSTLNAYAMNGGIDEHPDTISGGYSIPYSIGGGIAWEHAGKLMLSADYHYDMWGSCSALNYRVVDGDYKQYSSQKMYTDRQRINLGLEYVPNIQSFSYGSRIRYRAGFSYSTPYLRIEGQDGHSEYTLAAGVALPISNKINNRSAVSVGVQWTRRSAGVQSMPTENYVMLNIGMTFNERWFMKFKIL